MWKEMRRKRKKRKAKGIVVISFIWFIM